MLRRAFVIAIGNYHIDLRLFLASPGFAWVLEVQQTIASDAVGLGCTVCLKRMGTGVAKCISRLRAFSLAR